MCRKILKTIVLLALILMQDVDINECVKNYNIFQDPKFINPKNSLLQYCFNMTPTQMHQIDSLLLKVSKHDRLSYT